MASRYQMMEELGSKWLPRAKINCNWHFTDEKLLLAGGSFGTVYKAIEKSTGEIVAIKHVRPHEFMICCRFLIDRLEWF